MKWTTFFLISLLVLVTLGFAPFVLADGESVPGRNPNQLLDEEYTAKIRKYTTAPYFSSPLVDYLPASKTVPTPEVALGDVAGAPGILPYAEEVYKYMRLLEAASPRVRVISIGKTEEGREMIAVAISSEENLKTWKKIVRASRNLPILAPFISTTRKRTNSSRKARRSTTSRARFTLRKRALPRR